VCSSDLRLSQMGLVKQPRLSVIKLTSQEFETVLEMSNNAQ
jgi:predicted RNA-binding protein with PUA-like domain